MIYCIYLPKELLYNKHELTRDLYDSMVEVQLSKAIWHMIDAYLKKQENDKYKIKDSGYLLGDTQSWYREGIYDDIGHILVLGW